MCLCQLWYSTEQEIPVAIYMILIVQYIQTEYSEGQHTPEAVPIKLLLRK